MPCTKGMTGCASTCAHRRLVQEFRIARHNQEMARERVTLAWATEERLYKEEHGNLLTFKEWLKGHAQPDRHEQQAAA